MSLLLFALPLACQPTASGGDDSSPQTDEGPTWYADVKPIADRACMRCHEDGGLAPAFGDAAHVQSIAALIAGRVAEGSMPPPAPDPACREYEGYEGLVLTDAEKATIAAWADAGAPLGDPADDRSTPVDPLEYDWDLELIAPSSYGASFDLDGNDYRCFVLQLDNAEPLWIDGFGAMIDNRSIVHHVVAYTIDDDVTDVSDDPAGFSCNGLGESDWTFFTGWAPGGAATFYGPGLGMRLEAHQRFVLQMHYFGDASDDGQLDQSGIGFHLRDTEPEHAVTVYPLGTYNFTIPAGDEAYEVSEKIRWPYATWHVVSVFPHMHLLGRGFAMEAGPKGEPACMVDALPWDFHNQVALVYPQPFDVEEGDTIQLTCTYDNSATSPYQYNDPPQDVQFGEDSTDEMCFGFTGGYFD